MAERPSRILVVDDDIDILELLKYNLEKEGFHVKTLAKSKNTIKVAEKFSPDLVILDILMPNVDGFEVCEQLRMIPSFENTYIFFLTARGELAFQQTALKMGGDDFIEKLTGLRVLLFKVNSVLKKKYVIQKRFQEFNVGELSIDRKTSSVSFRNETVTLNEAEFEILFFLAQNRKRKLTIDGLIHNVWGPEIPPYNSVKLYIENLQRKISPDIVRVTKNNEYTFGL
jgi:two-component system, OmpR family, alkaline phosphatase synthesis response regulator PhoP